MLLLGTHPLGGYDQDWPLSYSLYWPLNTFLLTYYLITFLLTSNPGTRFQQPGSHFQNRFLRQITSQAALNIDTGVRTDSIVNNKHDSLLGSRTPFVESSTYFRRKLQHYLGVANSPCKVLHFTLHIKCIIYTYSIHLQQKVRPLAESLNQALLRCTCICVLTHVLSIASSTSDIFINIRQTAVLLQQMAVRPILLAPIPVDHYKLIVPVSIFPLI